MPRFEACEFGAAFVAANKDMYGGSVYLTTHWKAHGDLEYRYVISLENDELWIKAYDYYGNDKIFEGNIKDFRLFAFAEKDEK